MPSFSAIACKAQRGKAFKTRSWRHPSCFSRRIVASAGIVTCAEYMMRAKGNVDVRSLERRRWRLVVLFNCLLYGDGDLHVQGCRNSSTKRIDKVIEVPRFSNGPIGRTFAISFA